MARVAFRMVGSMPRMLGMGVHLVWIFVSDNKNTLINAGKLAVHIPG
jgi:hypothetical protein